MQGEAVPPGAVTVPPRPFEDITGINQQNVFIRQTQRLRKPDMLLLKHLARHVVLFFFLSSRAPHAKPACVYLLFLQ